MGLQKEALDLALLNFTASLIGEPSCRLRSPSRAPAKQPSAPRTLLQRLLFPVLEKFSFLRTQAQKHR